MNWLDIVLVCLAGMGFLKGLFDGMIKQVVSLIALFIAIFFCGKVAGWLSGYVVQLDFFSAESVEIISYVLGFVLILGVLLLVGEIMHKIIDVTPLGILNHFSGGIVGLLVMILFLSLSLNLLEIIDKKSVLISHETKIESRFYHHIQVLVPTIYPHKLFYNE